MWCGVDGWTLTARLTNCLEGVPGRFFVPRPAYGPLASPNASQGHQRTCGLAIDGRCSWRAVPDRWSPRPTHTRWS